MELYYSSVGRNSNLLLNVPPDRRGLLHENDVKSLIAFRDLREKEFVMTLQKVKTYQLQQVRGKEYNAANVNDGNPDTYWATSDDVTSASVVIDLGTETEMNRIILQEYIKLGQRVQEFKVEALINGEWSQLIDGTTIGHKVIRKFPVVKTSKLRLLSLNQKPVR